MTPDPDRTLVGQRAGGTVVDLFAGPGGWDLGARAIGLDPIGLEWDDAACATRRAAGLRTMQCDVAAVDLNAGWQQTPVWGLIASPPCQAWSMAGKGGGRRDKEHVVACAGEIAAGSDTRAMHAEKCEDPRSMLVVEPLRWALTLEPEWLAFEQVPPVLKLWSMFAQILALRGYGVWTGVLEAERYGVPQTRERAILLARRDGPVHPPAPTHQRYIPGEPARHDVTFDGEVLPWVSMAEALGWGMTERPGLTFAPGAGNGGAAYEGGSGARATLHRERARGAWAVQTGNFTAVERDADGGRSATGSVPYKRDVADPAPVVTGNVDRWKVIGLDRRQTGGDGTPVGLRDIDTPAPTLQAQGLAKGRDVWVTQRPATSVNGDPRIAAPGRHDPDVPGSQYGEGTVRVTIEEAAALQTFPPGYPWQGTQGQRFQQIGNAVPPLLAAHILRAVTGLSFLDMEVADAA